MIYTISKECVGCTLCSKKCPLKVIVGDKLVQHAINQAKCDGCGVCFKACPRGAIYDSGGKNNGRVVKKNKKYVASIDITICVGCKNCHPECIDLFAIYFVKGRFGSHSSVDESICSGCRACIAACPHCAIKIKEMDR